MDETYEYLGEIAKRLNNGINAETLRNACCRTEGNRLGHIRLGKKGSQIKARMSVVKKWLQAEEAA